MAEQPWVACVMPANGRRAMVQRAIECFIAQTYPNRRLVVWDTGDRDLLADLDFNAGRFVAKEILIPDVVKEQFVGATVGRLRNAVNNYAKDHYVFGERPALICHWDSDDWSHPRRIEEQVAFLQHASAICVGYSQVLFWQTGGDRAGAPWLFSHPNPRYCVGSSMMYTVDAWRKIPFDERVPSEDNTWWARHMKDARAESAVFTAKPGKWEPRMICAIHGGNTSVGYTPERMRPPSWREAAQFTDYCERNMSLCVPH